MNITQLGASIFFSNYEMANVPISEVFPHDFNLTAHQSQIIKLLWNYCNCDMNDIHKFLHSVEFKGILPDGWMYKNPNELWKDLMSTRNEWYDIYITEMATKEFYNRIAETLKF